MNEIKGTRMPDYSVNSKDRDIYGELGWIPNFNVKCSKNNEDRQTNNREYFDGPMNYHVTFNNSTMTNSEFFRKNAPHKSVARGNVQTMSVMNKSKFGSSQSSIQKTLETSIYATPFILDRDISNRWRNHRKVHATQQFTNSIPFLRTPHIEWNHLTKSPRNSLSPSENRMSTFEQEASRTFDGTFLRKDENPGKRRVMQIKKENGWDQYIKPISKYN